MSAVDDVARVLRRRLVEEARFEVAATDPGVLRCRIAALLTEEALPLDDSERAALVDKVVSGTIGLGPLEPLMDDPAVDEIMVNGRAPCTSSAAVASSRRTCRSAPTRS